MSGRLIISPLSVKIGGNKKFILNLNNYRNTHFILLNKAKQAYSKAIYQQIYSIGPYEKIHIEYKLFPKTKRRTDIANVTSIHAKFICDALVKCNVIEDDDYTHVVSSSELFVCVDANNPRVEILITEV